MSKLSDAKNVINENIELKLRWGTFCKGIALEPNTNETTVIGVLPSLKIAAQLLTGLDDKISIYLPIPLWLHASFICKNSNPDPTQINVEMSLQMDEQIHKDILPLTIKPTEVSSILNIRVNAPNGIPLHSGLQSLKASFVHAGKSVGEIELPISVDIISAHSIPEVK